MNKLCKFDFIIQPFISIEERVNFLSYIGVNRIKRLEDNYTSYFRHSHKTEYAVAIFLLNQHKRK